MGGRQPILTTAPLFWKSWHPPLLLLRRTLTPPLLLLQTHGAAAAVLRGMEVVYSIEQKGSSTGKLSSTVKIVDAGELPLLRHSRPGLAGNASAAADAEAAAEEQLD